MGADEEFDLEPQVAPPSGVEVLPGGSAPLYSEINLRAAVKGVAKRSMRRIVRDSFAGVLSSRSGIGSGSASDGGSRLMPEELTKFRRVRMFMKQEGLGLVWRKQESWMKDCDLNAVNQRLYNLKPFIMTPEERREFYGTKSLGVNEQYRRFVPLQHFADEIRLSSGGKVDGMAFRRTQTVIQAYFSPSQANTIHSQGDIEAQETQSDNRRRPVSHQGNRRRDLPLLRSIIRQLFDGEVPRSPADVKRLASLMLVAKTRDVLDAGK